jgi:hypothetical protein
MPNANEFKKKYLELNSDQQFIVIDGIIDLLKIYELYIANEYDSAKSREQRLDILKKILIDKPKLDQIIYSAKNQKKAILKNQGNDNQELWQLIEEFFEAK